jgi:hypothetical protein
MADHTQQDDDLSQLARCAFLNPDERARLVGDIVPFSEIDRQGARMSLGVAGAR